MLWVDPTVLRPSFDGYESGKIDFICKRYVVANYGPSEVYSVEIYVCLVRVPCGTGDTIGNGITIVTCYSVVFNNYG